MIRKPQKHKKTVDKKTKITQITEKSFPQESIKT